jgi:DNA-binding beta-propeller fold protein YncE
VPTSVELGSDGAYYVGQLTGFCFPVGAANVFTVTESTGVSIFESGFTNIVDIAFDDLGNLYVLEMAKDGLSLLEGQLFAGGPVTATGQLIKVAPDGTQTVLASDGLIAPTGMTVGPDGNIYVSNNGIFSGTGEVVRISQTPTGVSLSAFSGTGAARSPLPAAAVLALALPLAVWVVRRQRIRTGDQAPR